MWRPFQDVKQTFEVSHRPTKSHFRTQHHVVPTVEDNVLLTEMENLESEEEEHDRGLFHFRLTVFSSHLKSKVGITLVKATTYS